MSNLPYLTMIRAVISLSHQNPYLEIFHNQYNMTLSVRVICSLVVGIKASLDSDKIIKNLQINLLTSHKTRQSKNFLHLDCQTYPRQRLTLNFFCKFITCQYFL